MRLTPASLIVPFLFLTGVAASGQTTSGQHWVATWVSAQQAPRLPQANAANAQKKQAGPPAPVEFNNQTIRMVVHTTIGGKKVRVQFSNAYGKEPLTIAAAHIALRSNDSAITAGSDRALMFNGKSSVSIPVGAEIASDPAEFETPALGDVAVSVYVPGETGPASQHTLGLHTTYIVNGDATAQASFADPITSQTYYWLSGIQVLAPAATTAIVTLGDSITDGTRSTPNTDSSWPSFLARRLAANKATAHIAVLNQGISANRVLRDGAGVSVLARFDRDVIAQNSVKWMSVLEGINDIGLGKGMTASFGPRNSGPPKEEVAADDLIAAYKEMIVRAHEHGIKVIGGTLLPYEGAAYYSDSGNVVRQAVNQWIRTSGTYDWVVDFEKVVMDPEHPGKFRPDFDAGDHLHPNDTGYKAMSDSIDLSIFGASKASGGSNSRSR